MAKSIKKKTNEQNQVAILYSPGYGAGWSTWNQKHPEIIFSPDFVQWVLDGKPGGELAAETMANNLFGSETIYVGGAEQLEIKWLNVDTLFKVIEYDGYESIELEQNQNWITA